MKLAKPEIQGFQGEKWRQQISREVNRRPRTIIWDNLNLTGTATIGASTLLDAEFPAGYLIAPKWGVQINITGSFAANANNKTVTISFAIVSSSGGGASVQPIFTTTALPMNGGEWSVCARTQLVSRPAAGSFQFNSSAVWVAGNTSLATKVTNTIGYTLVEANEAHVYISINQAAANDILVGEYLITTIPGPDYV